MGTFDEGALADTEYHEPVPLLIPVQERHKVHPPADHVKLAWCYQTIVAIEDEIKAENQTLGMHRFDAHMVELELRVRLGDPKHSTLNWSLLVSEDPYWYSHAGPPHKGTWDEARQLNQDWKAIDALSAPVAERLELLKAKRCVYRAMLNELESNIKHWEGACTQRHQRK